MTCSFSKRYINMMYIHHVFRCATFVNYDTTRQRVCTKHRPCVRSRTSRRSADADPPRRGTAYYNTIELMQLSFPTPTGRCHHNRFSIPAPRLQTKHYHNLCVCVQNIIHSEAGKTNRSCIELFEMLFIYRCSITLRVPQRRL